MELNYKIKLKKEKKYMKMLKKKEKAIQMNMTIKDALQIFNLQ